MHDESHKFYNKLYTLLRCVIQKQDDKPKVFDPGALEEKIAMLTGEVDELRAALKTALDHKSTTDTHTNTQLPRDAHPLAPRGIYTPSTVVPLAHLQSINYPLQQAASSYSASPVSPVQFIHEHQQPPNVLCQPVPVYPQQPMNYTMVAPSSPPQSYNAVYARAPQHVFYPNY